MPPPKTEKHKLCTDKLVVDFKGHCKMSQEGSEMLKRLGINRIEDAPRNDKRLVEVVKTLGDRVNTANSDWRVVKVSPGKTYIIDEDYYATDVLVEDHKIYNYKTKRWMAASKDDSKHVVRMVECRPMLKHKDIETMFT